MITTTLLEEKFRVNKYLEFSPRNLSYLSFVNLFLWKDFFHFDFHVFDNCLCVFAQSEEGQFLYLPPLGEAPSIDIYYKCFELMQEQNQLKNVTRIENGYSQLQSLLNADFIFKEKSRDYYYCKNNIARLRGNAYKSQRALYNHFTKNYSFQYLPYASSMYEECMSLLRKWTQRKLADSEDPIFNQMLEENIIVNELALSFYEELELVGRVVSVKDEIKAYTFGFELSDDVFCVLLEIADLTVKGISCYIFSQLAKDEQLKRYSFLNAMDAWGLKNVAQTKMHFHPVMLVPNYVIKIKEIEM